MMSDFSILGDFCCEVISEFSEISFNDFLECQIFFQEDNSNNMMNIMFGTVKEGENSYIQSKKSNSHVELSKYSAQSPRSPLSGEEGSKQNLIQAIISQTGLTLRAFFT